MEQAKKDKSRMESHFVAEYLPARALTTMRAWRAHNTPAVCAEFVRALVTCRAHSTTDMPQKQCRGHGQEKEGKGILVG